MSKYGIFSGTYLLRKSPYSAQIWENKDQKKLRIWTPFTQWLSWRTANSFSYMYLPYLSDDDLILLCCCLIPKCKVDALGMFLLFFVLVYSFCWCDGAIAKYPFSTRDVQVGNVVRVNWPSKFFFRWGFWVTGMV